MVGAFIPPRSRSYEPRGLLLQDCGGSLSLENYMRLPVEQYYELDPAMIVPRQGNRFGLMVPRVHVGLSAFNSTSGNNCSVCRC